MKTNAKREFNHNRKRYMARNKGAKQVSKERKRAVLDLTDVEVKQHVITKHYSVLQTTVANIIRRRDSDSSNEIKKGGDASLT